MDNLLSDKDALETWSYEDVILLTDTWISGTEHVISVEVLSKWELDLNSYLQLEIEISGIYIMKRYWCKDDPNVTVS